MSKIPCPFCDATDIELFSLYGQTLLGSQYYCHSCQSIFEAIRYDDDNPTPSHSERSQDALTSSSSPELRTEGSLPQTARNGTILSES